MVIALICLCFPAGANEIDVVVTQEIGKLLQFIKESSCRFNRNGNWFDSTEAVDHIYKKYQYALQKNMVSSAEDFIKYAATKSSFSGKAYIVQCINNEPLTSAEWLTTALAQIRDQN